MKTAVEWLANDLKQNHGIDLTLYSEFDQAKQMEKEQMESAYLAGESKDKQYYNETFKSEE
jgi:hypothetical protein